MSRSAGIGTCSRVTEAAHVLVGKPVSTLPEHALVGDGRLASASLGERSLSPSCRRGFAPVCSATVRPQRVTAADRPSSCPCPPSASSSPCCGRPRSFLWCRFQPTQPSTRQCFGAQRAVRGGSISGPLSSPYAWSASTSSSGRRCGGYSPSRLKRSSLVTSRPKNSRGCYFGSSSARMTERRCEAFFDNGENLVPSCV
jgi:hypothetical protein